MKTTGETAVPVASSVRIRLPKSATFDCREQIGRAGGKFDGSTWSVTSEQLTLLREWAAESGRRFNKRDTNKGSLAAPLLRCFDLAQTVVEIPGAATGPQHELRLRIDEGSRRASGRAEFQ